MKRVHDSYKKTQVAALTSKIIMDSGPKRSTATTYSTVRTFEIYQAINVIAYNERDEATKVSNIYNSKCSNYEYNQPGS